MNYGKINKTDIANGPGVRVSLFVSGCTHHCKGCFNEEAWDFNYGNPYTDDIKDEILDALSPEYIEGLTILGGEPFELQNIKYVYELIKTVKEKYPNKTIWIYSGYTFDELMRRSIGFTGYNIIKEDLYTLYVLLLADVLVDGEFIEDKKDITLKFRGSSNQRLIDLKSTTDNLYLYSYKTFKVKELED